MAYELEYAYNCRLFEHDVHQNFHLKYFNRIVNKYCNEISEVRIQKGKVIFEIDRQQHVLTVMRWYTKKKQPMRHSPFTKKRRHKIHQQWNVNNQIATYFIRRKFILIWHFSPPTGKYFKNSRINKMQTIQRGNFRYLNKPPTTAQN